MKRVAEALLARRQLGRALGDALVVCVNSDESVRRLKGPGRPVMALGDRVGMLQALEMVDAVVPFPESSPAAVLERLRPDVWVKGEDYAGRELPEAEVVARHGGRVVLVPVLEHHSTTGVIATLRQGRATVPATLANAAQRVAEFDVQIAQSSKELT